MHCTTRQAIGSYCNIDQRPALTCCVAVRSRPLCHAVFDLYVGDQPVSRKAKRIVGESFQRLVEGEDGQYRAPRLQLVCDGDAGVCEL